MFDPLNALLIATIAGALGYAIGAAVQRFRNWEI